MTWDPITEPVDKVILAGRVSPGIAVISGASSPRKWEVREGYGLSGAWIIFRGVGLAQFQVQFKLYTVEDWADWHAFRDVVAKPPYGKRPRALDIVHPLVNDLGIVAVGVEEVSQPEQTDHGEWTVTLKLIEYRQPKAGHARPEGAAAGPVDPIEALIEQENAINQSLRDELAEP